MLLLIIDLQIQKWPGPHAYECEDYINIKYILQHSFSHLTFL